MNWIRKNQRKLLAVFVMFLMIAFVADIGLQRDFGRSSDAVEGHAGDEPLLTSEILTAQRDLNMLTESLRGMNVIENTLANYFFQMLAMQYGQFGNQFAQFAQMEAMQRARAIAREIKPEHYALLLKEARQMNIRVSRDQVENTITALLQQQPQRQVDVNVLRQAIANWMSVVGALERVSNAPKISKAAAVHAVASRQQEVTLNLVEFKADQLKGEVTPPTPEQLEQHFKEYQNRDPKLTPNGIGYRYPDRVKLDYIAVPLERVKATITPEEIYDYYRQNKEQFPVTQPATTQVSGPAGPPTSLPATTQASTAPAYRDWRDPGVSEEIRRILGSEQATKIAKQIEQTLRNDWQNYRNSVRDTSAATAPAQAPPSSLGVAYNSYVYLQRLQERIQKSREARGVLPHLATYGGDFMTKEEVNDIPGIGNARTRQGAFADYVFAAARPLLVSPARKPEEGELALFQPSQVITDGQGVHYICRLTAVDPAHPAESLGVVSSKAKEDWIRLRAYEKAKAAASSFLENAKAKGLAGAANAAGEMPVINTGSFSAMGSSLEKPKLSDEKSRQELVESAFKLLHERLKSGQKNPMGLIELPRIGTIYVAQLDDAKPATKSEYFEALVAQAQMQNQVAQSARLLQTWFSPTSIESRMHYKPANVPARQPDQMPEQPRRSGPLQTM